MQAAFTKTNKFANIIVLLEYKINLRNEQKHFYSYTLLFMVYDIWRNNVYVQDAKWWIIFSQNLGGLEVHDHTSNN